MKITLVSQYYPPERGAVGYGHRVACGLARGGHTVTVFAGIPHFPTAKPYEGFSAWKMRQSVEDGVRVVRLPLVMGSNTQTARRVLGFATFAFSVFVQLLRMPRQDIIITSVPPPTTSLPVLIVSWIRHSEFVVLLRDIEPLRSLSQRGLAGGWMGRAIIRMFMWVYKRSARIVVMHPSEIDVLAPYGIAVKQTVVIPHGVEIAPPSGNVERNAPSLPRRGGRLVALYAGTIGLVHGLQRLIESVADERIQAIPIDFIIVGDGQYAEDCRRLIHRHGIDNVIMLPAVSPNRVQQLLHQADILVCSYRNEDDVPLGSKFYEYCAIGKPILVHGRNLAGRVVEQIGNGLSCEAGDIPGLAKALQEFAQHRERWADLGRKGREYAQRHFAQCDRDRRWQDLLSGFDQSRVPIKSHAADSDRRMADVQRVT